MGSIPFEHPGDRLGSESSRDQLLQIISRIYAAQSLDTLLIELETDILDLFDAERMTFYAVDREKQQIYSRPREIDNIEIRLAFDPKSLAGYVAHTGECVSVADAYDGAELARIARDLRFDQSWDRITGFRTRQVLAVRVTQHARHPMGVLQLLNKKHAGRFTREDERNLAEIATALFAAFSSLDESARRRPGKFDYLLNCGLITQEQLAAAIAEARCQQTDVESVLVDKGQVDKADIGVALSMFYQCQFVEFSDRIVIPPDLLATVKVDYLRFNSWVPLARQGNLVDVLIDNPHDVQKVDNVRRVFADCDVRFSVGLRQDILQFIESAAGTKASSISVSSILGELVPDAPVEEEASGGSEIDINDSMVVRLAHQLIIDACKAGASDIHIEPRGAHQPTVVRFRVDGSCVEYERLPPAFRQALVARFKIMAQLDVAERRRPQDGKLRFLIGGRDVELRLATMPTAGGNEDAAIRILTGTSRIALEDLGMSDPNLRETKRIASKPYGLILCVGPTGSGKTTTLHAVLGFLNTPERKIWTAEDPVEITQEGLRQVQVQPKIGLTFAAALRGVLRVDPDVIMVGEMRDAETASTGVGAALTGHLVLSTLHTGSAADTVVRLLDMGIDSFILGDALLGILAQRLVKRLCPNCTEPYHPGVDEFIGHAMEHGEREFEALGIHYDDTLVLHRAAGCSACNQTGYKGRVAIHELLVASSEIKRLIQTRARVAEILAQARAEGMTTLVQDGILKSRDGVTDLKQVYAVAVK